MPPVIPGPTDNAAFNLLHGALVGDFVDAILDRPSPEPPEPRDDHADSRRDPIDHPDRAPGV